MALRTTITALLLALPGAAGVLGGCAVGAAEDPLAGGGLSRPRSGSPSDPTDDESNAANQDLASPRTTTSGGQDAGTPPATSTGTDGGSTQTTDAGAAKGDSGGSTSVDSGTSQPEAQAPTGRWFQADGQECTAFCGGLGKQNVASPDGARCTSGELIPASAVGVIAYNKGCWPNCGVHAAANGRSEGSNCYGDGQKRDGDSTDRTMGCFCL